MATLAFTDRLSCIDAFLEEACVKIQLTQTQFDSARQKYAAIGRWLSDPASPLLRYAPDIYPQGSMSLGTTIRPWQGEEFDLDIVCQLHGCSEYSPEQVFAAVHQRLNAHGLYSKILEPRNRCLRINYAGDFHLDIIPACPDDTVGSGAIKVPDRKLAVWKRSNPLGYASSFFERCRYRLSLIEAEEKRFRPLPNNAPSEHKYPLQRAVQLLKRHRDSFFKGDPDAARSILLTTLAAGCYQGQQSLTLALDGIVDGILAIISQTPGIPVVLNPTNPMENLAEGWNQDTYPQFIAYVRSLRAHLGELMRGDGIQATTRALGDLVGEPLAKSVVLAHADQVQRSRNDRSLRVEPGTGRFSATAGIIVPRNNFYGKC
ncbi:MAG TPA: nucleotidyltransferase [Bryobacteraceae bacterium]|nr:nucleotidyltransferase [Bryobacteraceae bacterium]